MGYYNLSRELDSEDEAQMKGTRHQLSSKMDRNDSPCFRQVFHRGTTSAILRSNHVCQPRRGGGGLSFAGNLESRPTPEMFA